MRIAICGTACQGKTTLINDIIKEWPMYSKSKESYRKVITEEKLKINRFILLLHWFNQLKVIDLSHLKEEKK